MKWWGIWPILFFFAVSPVTALTLSFSNPPVSIDQNQEFSVDINLICSSCGDSYLRGVFYLSGTNYFGYTKNNSGEWINLPGSQAGSYFRVLADEVKEGSWSGKLIFKPDSADSAYTGPGVYNFKIGRLTSGGSATWSDPVPVTITGPMPTSAPSSTPVHVTSVPTPKPTQFPTQIPVISVSKKPTPKSTLTLTLTSTNTPAPIPVLSASTGADPNTPPPWPAIMLIFLGLGSIVYSFLIGKPS
jgi:hypothetical protein